MSRDVTLLAVNARPEPIAILDGVPATLVPDSNCLRTADGDASYAEFFQHGATSSGINAENSVLWTAEPAPAGVRVTRAQMFAQVRSDAPGWVSLQLGWSNADGSAWGVVWPGFGTQPFMTAAYAEYGGDLNAAALMAAGGADLSSAIFYAGIAAAGGGHPMRVTYAYVLLTVEDLSVVRQRQIPGQVRQRQVPGIVRQRQNAR